MWRPMYEPWPHRKQRESNNMTHTNRSITRTGVALLGFLALLCAGCSPSASTGDPESGPTVYTDAEFDQWVKQADQPVLVDFTATWCPPCKRMKPILAELEKERAGSLSVVEVDVDANPELAQQYQIQYLPTFVLYLNGKALDLRYGMIPKDELTTWIDDLLANANKPATP